MKHLAILFAGTVLASSFYATSPNPYPNEIKSLKFYEQYLAPLAPQKSDTAQVIQVLGSDQGLELKDWRIRALYSCTEDFLTCSHGPRNDLLAAIEVMPRHRVSLRRFKFPTVFSRSFGEVSEINVTCDIYTDEFGLEYWIVSKDFPPHRKGDLLMIQYRPRRTTNQDRVLH